MPNGGYRCSSVWGRSVEKAAEDGNLVLVINLTLATRLSSAPRQRDTIPDLTWVTTNAVVNWWRNLSMRFVTTTLYGFSSAVLLVPHSLRNN
ncbi:hypothetical protein HPB48_014915 [Haemaphysalis longicornis]|uniref:Uncharacterized protein n=1 Tax=Haemaphysalis longicornis TaxID=44386 RepID=A0A9J6GAX3_HAELO|nr:hypothetical protein HPB48_014915 [Haemaphysalis longicornis]